MPNEITTTDIISTNAEVKEILKGLKVGSKKVAVEYLFYEGHGEPYIVFSQYDKDNSYSCEDEIAGYVTYYDIEIYSQGNILSLIEEIKKRFKKAKWTWQPRRDGPDTYDQDTHYYGKTLCFAKPIQEVDEEKL